jgi:hypothetical protein
VNGKEKEGGRGRKKEGRENKEEG